MQQSPYAQAVPDILAEMNEGRDKSGQQPMQEYDVYVEEDRITFVKTAPGEQTITEDTSPGGKEASPSVFPPLFCAFLCIAAIIGVTLYSAIYPTYEHETFTIPAHFLPPQSFSVTAPIIPTGIRTYPATQAHGILTL